MLIESHLLVFCSHWNLLLVMEPITGPIIGSSVLQTVTFPFSWFSVFIHYRIWMLIKKKLTYLTIHLSVAWQIHCKKTDSNRRISPEADKYSFLSVCVCVCVCVCFSFLTLQVRSQTLIQAQLITIVSQTNFRQLEALISFFLSHALRLLLKKFFLFETSDVLSAKSNEEAASLTCWTARDNGLDQIKPSVCWMHRGWLATGRNRGMILGASDDKRTGKKTKNLPKTPGWAAVFGAGINFKQFGSEFPSPFRLVVLKIKPSGNTAPQHLTRSPALFPLLLLLLLLLLLVPVRSWSS